MTRDTSPTMTPDAVNARCVRLLRSPALQTRMWHPRMFWDIGKLENPDDANLVKPKVDVDQLEVMLAAAAQEPSECLEAVEERRPGKGRQIQRMVRQGQMPLLDRTSAS